MFELLVFVGIVAVVGLVVLAGAFVVEALKIGFNLVLLPFAILGFLIKAIVAVVAGLVALVVLAPFVVSGLALLALPLLLIVGVVWMARKIVSTA